MEARLHNGDHTHRAAEVSSTMSAEDMVHGLIVLY
jgi:hypothetical protein